MFKSEYKYDAFIEFIGINNKKIFMRQSKIEAIEEKLENETYIHFDDGNFITVKHSYIDAKKCLLEKKNDAMHETI